MAVLSLTFLLIALAASENLLSSGESHRRPAILPLYSPSPIATSFQRRKLQKSDISRSSDARMRLYDDLLLNGYYTTRLRIGTPPQEFALIVDTGSTVTYVPCADCEHCGKHQDPRFEPKSSSTYEPVKCSMSCNCDSAGVQCTYERRYAEMSSSNGVLANDVLSFGNESALSPQRAVFGCETSETGDLYSQRADGIIGLGRGPLSVMDQLVEKGAIEDSFSLCYGGMGVGGGAMVLGRIDSPPDMVFTHSDPGRSPYYNIELKEMHVAGKPLKLSATVFDRKYGTVLDSGTTYAYLPAEAFRAFKDAVMKELHSLKQIHGPDPNYNDICFSGAGRDVTQLSKYFPIVDMVFENGQKLSLTPENYLFQHTKVNGAYCFGIFQNADQTTLLGGIVVRNTLVTYDRENNKVGFSKTNCSQLWKTSTAFSPAPTPVESDDPSTQISPSLAPKGQPETVFPGEIHYGVITFDMTLGVNTSRELNVTELTEFIANELQVDASQIHLMNIKHEGNYSVVRWAISPEGSESYFPKTKAMGIILRLKERHMQLPEQIGDYQLIKLEVEPQRERSWVKRHSWIVALGVGATLAIGVSMIGLMVWRYKRRNADSYEPVGSSVGPEQELQPLQPI